jgi:hypothetical protein
VNNFNTGDIVTFGLDGRYFINYLNKDSYYMSFNIRESRWFIDAVCIIYTDIFSNV